MVEGSGFPRADDKIQIGSKIILLGLELFLRQGRVRVTDRKQRLYVEWLDRALDLEFMEVKEFRSLLGTLNFGLITAPAARRHNQTGYNLLYSKRPIEHRKGRQVRTLTDKVKVAFANLRKAFVTATGYAMMDELVHFEPSTPEHQGWTDACREPRGFSGMGGYCRLTDQYWFYELKGQELELPIHITEFIASLIQLRLNAKELSGEQYREHIDNMAVVSVMKTQHARDERMVELLRIRREILDQFGIEVDTRWIASKANSMADALSRDAEDEFLEEVNEESDTGRRLKRIDLAQSDLIPDLTYVMKTMIAMTRERKRRGEPEDDYEIDI